jgi:hypothetical protein
LLSAEAGAVMPSPPTATYPKRPSKVFALDYIRAITDDAIASEIGPFGYMLLVVIVLMEDVTFYTRAVSYSDRQLEDRMGCDRKTIRKARQACIEAGFLHFQPSDTKGRGSLYFVKLPDNDPRSGVESHPLDGTGMRGKKSPSSARRIRGTEVGKNPPHLDESGGEFPRSVPHTSPYPMYTPSTPCREGGVSLKPQRHGKKETRRSLLGVTDAELRDTAALLSRIKALRSEGVLQSTEGDELNAIAAAERALAHGKRPAALWVTLVRDRDWEKLSDADVDAANRRRKQHQRDTTPAGGPASASVAGLAASFAPPQSASPEVYE